MMKLISFLENPLLQEHLISGKDLLLNLELLEDVIYSDNDSWSKYLWSWLAHIIQKPYEKPGVAIVLRSDRQGVGKSVFGRYFGSLLGSHFTTVTTERHLHGNFNAHLKKCLFLLGEEVFWGG